MLAGCMICRRLCCGAHRCQRHTRWRPWRRLGRTRAAPQAALSVGLQQPKASRGTGTSSWLPHKLRAAVYDWYTAGMPQILRWMMYPAAPSILLYETAVRVTRNVALPHKTSRHASSCYLNRHCTIHEPTGCARGHLTLRSICRMGRPSLVGRNAEDPAAQRSCTQDGRAQRLATELFTFTLSVSVQHQQSWGAASDGSS